MTITEHLEAMMEEVVQMDRRLADWARDPNRKPLDRSEVSIGYVLGNRSITPKGAKHLWDASELLLKRERLEARVSSKTARDLLDRELQAEIKRAREKNRWSSEAVIRRTAEALHKLHTFSGNCFFPAFIKSSGQEIDLEFGPVRVVSRDVFEAEFSNLIDGTIALDDDADQLVKNESMILTKWREHVAPYPFFIIVRVEGFELEMARPAARQAAEFVLNLLRMMARPRDGRAIRLSGDVRPETQQAFLAITSDGKTCGSLSMDGEGALLPDDWPTALLETISTAKHMVDTIAERLVCGDPFTDPVIERIRYADQLFTEAFQDPSPRLSLVKLVAAFEALAVLPKDRKAQTLELRCALASSCGDPDYVQLVRKAVGRAYKVRNDVVHGDAPEPYEAANAIYELQECLFNVVLHMWRMLINIHNEHKPQSIRPLRKQIREAYEAERERCEDVWHRIGIKSPLRGSVESERPTGQ